MSGFVVTDIFVRRVGHFVRRKIGFVNFKTVELTTDEIRCQFSNFGVPVFRTYQSENFGVVEIAISRSSLGVQFLFSLCFLFASINFLAASQIC